MDIEELKKDEAQLKKAIVASQNRIQQAQAEYWRLEGALLYVKDNIAKQEEKDDRKEPDRKE